MQAMRRKELPWEVFRMRASAAYLGTVSAPDEDSAIKQAIKAFAIAAKSLLVRRIARS
jgi:hypothetical protein